MQPVLLNLRPLQGNGAISCGNSEKQPVKIAKQNCSCFFFVHNVYLILKIIYTLENLFKKESIFTKIVMNFMYIAVLLIHPRKGLNVFAATSHSSITHFFVSKNLNIIYSKITQSTPKFYCNAV